jgi:hypothetical protein
VERSIIFYNILEYYNIKNSPNELLEYIKKMRMPYAKKYEKELKEIYTKIILFSLHTFLFNFEWKGGNMEEIIEKGLKRRFFVKKEEYLGLGNTF